MTKYLLLFLAFTSTAFANEDVCCIFTGTSGDSVQTYARIQSSSDCKAGGTYQGKKICAALPDPDNSYCGGGSSYQDRCGKCGFFWSGKECLIQDPKEKAKKELQEEAKKKEADKKAGIDSSAKPSTPAPAQSPADDPDNPKINNAVPEEDSLYNRKSKGITDQ